MKEPSSDYVLAKSVFDFIDVRPYEYPEVYVPYYGMTYLLWEDQAQEWMEFTLDENVQDYELEPYIKKGYCYVSRKKTR